MSTGNDRATIDLMRQVLQVAAGHEPNTVIRALASATLNTIVDVSPNGAAAKDAVEAMCARMVQTIDAGPHRFLFGDIDKHKVRMAGSATVFPLALRSLCGQLREKAMGALFRAGLG